MKLNLMKTGNITFQPLFLKSSVLIVLLSVLSLSPPYREKLERTYLPKGKGGIGVECILSGDFIYLQMRVMQVDIAEYLLSAQSSANFLLIPFLNRTHLQRC